MIWIVFLMRLLLGAKATEAGADIEGKMESISERHGFWPSKPPSNLYDRAFLWATFYFLCGVCYKLCLLNHRYFLKRAFLYQCTKTECSGVPAAASKLAWERLSSVILNCSDFLWRTNSCQMAQRVFGEDPLKKNSMDHSCHKTGQHQQLTRNVAQHKTPKNFFLLSLTS